MKWAKTGKWKKSTLKKIKTKKKHTHTHKHWKNFKYVILTTAAVVTFFHGFFFCFWPINNFSNACSERCRLHDIIFLFNFNIALRFDWKLLCHLHTYRINKINYGIWNSLAVDEKKELTELRTTQKGAMCHINQIQISKYFEASKVLLIILYDFILAFELRLA